MKIQKQGFETELNHKETRDKRYAVLITILPVVLKTGYLTRRAIHPPKPYTIFENLIKPRFIEFLCYIEGSGYFMPVGGDRQFGDII